MWTTTSDMAEYCGPVPRRVVATSDAVVLVLLVSGAAWFRRWESRLFPRGPFIEGSGCVQTRSGLTRSILRNGSSSGSGND
jgi:hypothetical protein